MQNASLDEAQAGIKIAGRIINNLRYAEDTTLTGESKGKLKSFLMNVKEESEKTGLKFNIQKLRSWPQKKKYTHTFLIKLIVIIIIIIIIRNVFLIDGAS